MLPSSAKNQTKNRDRISRPPEIHQTEKTEEWHFGMRMCIGADDTLGLIHNIDTTIAKVHNIVPPGMQLHDGGQRDFSYSGYVGNKNRMRKNKSR